MRVVHLAIYGYPQHRTSGPIIYLHHLAREQRWAGDEVTVVCASERHVPGPPYAPELQRVEGIDYVHVHNRPVEIRDVWNPQRETSNPELCAVLARVLDERAPDVVHVQNFAGLSMDVVETARRSGARVVASLHNYTPICSRDDLFFANAEPCDGPLKRSCSRCLGTMVGDEHYRARHAAGVAALNACDVTLPVSTRVGELFREHGVRDDRMRVEPIGTVVGERLWRALGAERVRQARAGSNDAVDGPLRIVFFGSARLHRKGVAVLFQALRRVARPERLHVNVCGALDDRRALDGYLETCTPELREALHFTTAFKQEDLPRLLGDADVAVLTPRWEDNGPQTVFEALAAGLPVVATRMGGIPDFVHDGVNGTLVEEGDVTGIATALDRLIADRGELLRLRTGIAPPRTMRAHADAVARCYAGEPVVAPRTLEYVDREATAGTTPVVHAAEPVAPAGWRVRWPEEERDLVAALALAAAFSELVPVLEVGVEGDLEQAATAVLGALGAEGIEPETLPDITLDAARSDHVRPLAELPDALADAAARRAATQPPAFGHADDRALAELADDTVPADVPIAFVGSRCDGIVQLATRRLVTLVADDPHALALAREAGVTVVAPGAWTPDAGTAIVVDGHDPRMLCLAADRAPQDATPLVAGSPLLRGPALAALGLDARARLAPGVIRVSTVANGVLQTTG
ncbi:MAG TPA: glycosyltransferase [Conexibacter sp.]|jgi:glycosyltransferase involved in cell wall biosynthesis|nr:glycosyltransferase [Conexibacter sp.]